MYETRNTNLKGQYYLNWDKIIRENLNNKPDELKNHLLVLGYSDDVKTTRNGIILKDITTYIKTKVPIILANQAYISNTEYKITQKEKEKNSVVEATTGKILLEKPIYLDQKKTIGTYENMVDKNTTNFNYNYALSSWIFLHNNGTNQSVAYVQDTPLLNYGNRPVIMWNGKQNTLKVKMIDVNKKLKTIYKTETIPLQRWINIVINYNGGTLDVFIDKTLVASVRNIIPYMSYDTVTTGANNGISGGICNVVYYSNNLTKNQIEIYYDLLKNKNPPVI